jgi:PAS domain S-box-containing protein
MVVVDGWDVHLGTRAKNSDGFPGDVVSFFLPIKQGDRVLAVLATTNEAIKKNETLQHIEITTPLLDQVAIALNQVALYQNTLAQSLELSSINDRLHREVSERQRAEQSLKFQNTLLATQQEATIDGILVVGEDRNWMSFNQQFIKMWDIPQEAADQEDSGEAVRIIVNYSVDKAEFTERLRYLHDHPVEKSRDEISLVDGRVFDRYSTPMLGTDGEYYGRVWYFRDVTDDKRNEEALRHANDDLEKRVAVRTAELRESEERFLQLAENIHEAFYVVSIPERVNLYVSPAFETIWDISRDTLYKNPLVFWEHLFEEDRPKLRAAFKLEEQGTATQTEYRILRKDGSTRWIWDQGFPVRDEKGEVYRVVGIAEDITEQKLLAEQLFQAQKMDAVGKLAGGVAHDFNNLLTVINGYSKLGLRNLGEKDPLRGNLEEIHRAGERAQGLTSQLLAFSRKQMLQPQILDVNMAVANSQKMLHRLIGEDLELSATMRAKNPIEADPVQLEQVLMNLALNARDAMPTGGKLTIETRDVVLDLVAAKRCQVPAGEYVCLSVKDTGCGMDKETLLSIFEPFFTTKEQGRGTGLGLSTVYGIVTQSGGGIDVDSILGQGSTFHIYLPCHKGDVPRDEPNLRNDMIIKGEGTVLVAEDEDIVRMLTVAVLQESGYVVLDARNGEEACQLFEDHQDEIDLLVTDIVMPQMSGKTLADKLRALSPELKVLFVSGYTDDVIGNHGVLDSRVPFLQKPFMPEQLSAKVREVMIDTG